MRLLDLLVSFFSLSPGSLFFLRLLLLAAHQLLGSVVLFWGKYDAARQHPESSPSIYYPTVSSPFTKVSPNVIDVPAFYNPSLLKLQASCVREREKERNGRLYVPPLRAAMQIRTRKYKLPGGIQLYGMSFLVFHPSCLLRIPIRVPDWRTSQYLVK